MEEPEPYTKEWHRQIEREERRRRLTWSATPRFACPLCGEGYRSAEYSVPAVYQTKCNSVWGCRETFTVAFVDLSDTDFASIMVGDPTPAATETVRVLGEHGLKINVWALHPPNVDLDYLEDA